ncbi:MAG: DNA-binding protein [Anaerolineae bacterium]|nr:DNA-binding protein [Anaerolineae bacterium]
MQVFGSRFSDVIIIKLDSGEEIFSSLKQWAAEQQVFSGTFYAIGALARAVLGYFDPKTRDYLKIPVESQTEVVCMLGNLAIGEDRAPIFHIHVILSFPDGRTVGGHLFEGVVNPTLEITFFPVRTIMLRRFDPGIGLRLLSV